MPHEGNVRVDSASLVLFTLPVLLVAVMFHSQRKRQRAFDQTQAGLSAGQEVVTTCGMFARIIEIDDAIAVLEISPGQRVRWDRRAIASVVPAATLATSKKAEG